MSNVVSENLETQLHDSGSSSQPLLVKLDKNVYNKRLENLYSRGYILGLCTIVGHPENNEYLCLDKKPDKIEDKNKLFFERDHVQDATDDLDILNMEQKLSQCV